MPQPLKAQAAAAAIAKLNTRAENICRASGRAAMSVVFLSSEEIPGEASKAYWVMNPILPA